MGWMEELLLGGEQVRWVVQIVERVEEVHLPGRRAQVGTLNNKPKFSLVQAHLSTGGAVRMFLLTSRVSSLLVYLPFISEQDRRNLLSKRAEPLASL